MTEEANVRTSVTTGGGVDLQARRCVVVGDGALLQPCADRLASLGARVAVITDQASAASLAPRRDDRLGTDLAVTVADWSDWGTAQRVAGALAAELGGFDVLVTLPISDRPKGSFLADDPASMTATVRHLFFGVIATVRAAIDVMDRGGRIVNVVSHTGSVGAPDAVVYDSCQAAVLSLGRNLAQELPDLGLTVVTVAAGLIEGADPELLPRHTLGRYASPNEIADMVAVAASPWSEYAHGSVLAMTGGLE